jgi:sialate O-acetylesterase
MVLQRDKPIRIFGFAKPNDVVSVSIGKQTKREGKASQEGKWSIEFDPIAIGQDVSTITVLNQTSNEQVQIQDVLLGDVWVMGGQSNMEFDLYKVYDGDLEVVSAHFPQIRLLTIPADAGPEKRMTFQALDEFNDWTGESEWKGRWDACTPKTARMFSAIGYVFGRRLHQAGQIPIGLIDASRGGTTVETWTSRESLQKIPDGNKLVSFWDKQVADFDPDADLAKQMQNWERHAAEQRKIGREPRPKPQKRPGPALDQNRPANCFNRMLAVMDGLAVRGVVWHQGYNNALGDARPRLYADALQAMIGDWRTVFRDENLPFGIVSFSSGGEPQTRDNFEVRMIDPSAYIREAQFRAARELKHVSYVAAWDEQMNWYHPFKKIALAERIARWAMAETLKLDITWKPASLVSHEILENQIVLTFDVEVKPHDSRDFEGFAIAGEDRHFYPAYARHWIKGKDPQGKEQSDLKRIVVSHPLVPKPVAVRHAWARNPLGNATSGESRIRIHPVPGFRTDTWDFPEAPIVPNDDPKTAEHRRILAEMRRQAENWAKDRRKAEAQRILDGLEANR